MLKLFLKNNNWLQKLFSLTFKSFVSWNSEGVSETWWYKTVTSEFCIIFLNRKSLEIILLKTKFLVNFFKIMVIPLF